MANLSFVVVPTKVKKDGTNRVRLSVSHHSMTKYIATDVIVTNSQFRNGIVIAHPHSKQMNLKLNKLMGEYLDALYSIENPDSFSCEQITQMLRELHAPKDMITVSEATERLVNFYNANGQEHTAHLNKVSIQVFQEFAKIDYPLNSITHDMANRYAKWLKSNKKYSSSTIVMRVVSMKRLFNFCISEKLCSTNNPFNNVPLPKPARRDHQISIEEMKTISKMEFSTKAMYKMRDMFMLSFYLGGMNFVDIYQLRFDGDYLRFKRQKTRNRTEMYTTIPILPEAREIIDRYITPDGTLAIGKHPTYKTAQNTTCKLIKRLGDMAGITTPFTFYSARKTFIQIGVQLMIPLHILEYCCGETPKTDNPIQRYFVITKEIAGDAMRKIFDVIK